MSAAKLHWSLSLWPGLPQLWTRGSWAGLALAVGFTGLINALIATTLVWDQWLPPQGRALAAGTAALIWTLAWIEGRADWRRWRAELVGDDATDQDAAVAVAWFRSAQRSYLSGDWIAAEQTIDRLLKADPRDAEARLLRATLRRRQGRLSEASQELDRLELLETGATWAEEIAAERKQIAAASVELTDAIVPRPQHPDADDSSPVRPQQADDPLADDRTTADAAAHRQAA